MLRFWSFIYRLTGWYSPWAKAAELEMLKTILFEGGYDETFTHEELSISIGMWQVKHKFTRRMKCQ